MQIESVKIMFGMTQKFVYTDCKGEERLRTVVPHYLWFGTSPHHPGPQWMLEALDVEENEMRSFALADVKTGMTVS